MEDMQQILTQRWTKAAEEAARALQEAEQHLGWVANIYGGQISLETLRDDVRAGGAWEDGDGAETA